MRKVAVALAVLAASFALFVGAASATQRVRTVLTLHIPTNGSATLASISCPTIRFCATDDGTVMRVTTDGGAKWSSDPIEPHYGVYEVSCPAVGDCRGVGIRDGNYQRFMTNRSALTWVSSSRDIDEIEPTSISTMSCPSRNECVAGGANNISGGNSNGYPVWVSTDLADDSGSPLATWRSSLIPFRRGSIVVGLAAISCASVTTCYALAQMYDSGAVLMKTTTGAASWTRVTVNRVAELERSRFSGLSCPSVTSCTFVGLSPNNRLLIIDTSDGGQSWRWVSIAAPNPDAPDYSLPVVSCATVTACEVADGHTVLHTSDEGRHWSSATVSRSDGLVFSLSCPSSTTCFAATQVPVVQHGQIMDFLVGHVLSVTWR